jgi:hypothetical protein
MEVIMKKILYVAAVIGMCGVSNGMLVMQDKNDMFRFFYPREMKIMLTPVTLDSFKRDSNCLYLSIDDFLDANKRQINEHAYSTFVKECCDLVPYHNEYRSVLINGVIPEFEKFTKEDAPCEVAGFYEDTKVIDFCEYLGNRLKVLESLLGE